MSRIGVRDVAALLTSFVRAWFVNVGRAIRRFARRHPKKTFVFCAWVLYTIGFVVWFRGGAPLEPRVERNVVNDVTQINPIDVAQIVYPHSVQDVQQVLQNTHAPIAIGGGHYSMGGQTACEGCISLDMRQMNHILELDVPHQRIRVEAGTRWRQIQEAIDPHNLSVRIMQTYANFTVGGALSVNCHGRYIGEGPVIRSVESIKLVLADGSLVTASPTENSDLFYGAIGGYGGIGVIVEATLRLADNTHIERSTDLMPVEEYGQYFREHVRNNRAAVFHNGDIYPPNFTSVRAVTWATTDHPLTEPERLMHTERPGWFGRSMLYLVTETAIGPYIRSGVYDTWLYRDTPVVTRNHEASYDVIELEPASRKDSTYVLQEFFIPVSRFDEYVPKMRHVLQSHHVQTLNVSIRHAHPDPGSLMAWAREESFSFVLYYKQGTTPQARAEVGVWTRELVDAALSVGGTYYLPYQPHPTLAQFRRAYPRFDEFVALKRRVDPQYRFRNTLWDTYLPPTQDPLFRARTAMHADPASVRSEGQTFLTLPEWYIVFSAEEYAQTLAREAPSHFPYFSSNSQFWSSYRAMYQRTRDQYPANTEYHTMNCVIGVSYSLENLIKGVYENTIGRITEWFADADGGVPDTAEDRYAAEVASEYNTFIRTYPWYEFPYWEKFKGLWKLDSSRDVSWIRKWERRFILSIEYGAKTLYASAIGAASHSAYGVEELTTNAWVYVPESAPSTPHVITINAINATEQIVRMPRYEGFRDTARAFIANGGQFRQIAGNNFVSMTVVAPRGFRFTRADGEVTTRWPVLTDNTHERAMIFVPVRSLHTIIPSLEQRGVTIDHVFDF